MWSFTRRYISINFWRRSYYLNYERGRFEVVTLGNHEFDYGKKQLDKLGKQISSTYINSNFYFNSNKSSIYEPYKIMEVGSKKIGFIDVVTTLTFTKTYLVGIIDEIGNSMYDFRGEELAQVMQNYINGLKEKNVLYYFINTCKNERWTVMDFFQSLKVLMLFKIDILINLQCDN